MTRRGVEQETPRQLQNAEHSARPTRMGARGISRIKLAVWLAVAVLASVAMCLVHIKVVWVE
jgi:hypothetical protein